MKIYNQAGSKERFLEMFQGVNKIKLNEAIISADNTLVTKSSILTNAFNELNSGALKITNTNSQSDNDENHVEISGTDDAGNQVTFRFRTTTSQGDQDGVFSVDSAELIEFIFRNNSYNIEIGEGDKILQQFNSERGEELIDAVSEYSDDGGSEAPDVEDSLYEEATNLIDRIPYKKGTEDMQTNKAYADQKPTNPAVRVQSKELDENMNSILHYSQAARDSGVLYPKAKDMGITNQHILKQFLWKDIGAELIDIEPQGNDKYKLIFRFEGQTYGAIINKNYGNAQKVINIVKKKLDKITGQNNVGEISEFNKYLNELQDYDDDNTTLADDDYTQDSPIEDPLAEPTEYSAADASAVLKKNNDDDGTKGISPWEQEVNDYSNEPVEQVSPEKATVITQAYDNLVKSGIDAPTLPQIMAEINKINGATPAKKTRTIPKGAEFFWESSIVRDVNADDALVKSFAKLLTPEKKNEYIKIAIEVLNAHLGVKRFQIPKEQYIRMVKELALIKFNKDASDVNENNLNETDYPKEMEIGKEFKTKNKYPKPKKHRPKRVTSVDESTDRDRYEDVVFLQGDDANEPLEILSNEGVDAAMEYLKQWHDSGNHMGSQELGHGSSDQTYEKDGYIMSWNSKIGYIGLQYDLSKMNETELAPEENPELTDADGEMGDDVLKGGLGDDKTPTDFSPEQVSLGIKVEMEHTSDPKVALEITLDHLSEDPEYYTVKDDPEASAQFNAASDASGDEKSDVEKENPDVYPDGWKEMDGMFMSPNNPMYKALHGGDSEDKEMTDALLGYKSKNVGDIDEEFDFASAEVGYDNNNRYQKYLKYTEMDFNNLRDEEKEEYFELWKEFKGSEVVQEEIGMEDYNGKMGDKYADAEGNEFSVSNKVKGGVSLRGQGGEKEVATGDLTLMKKLGEATDPITQKQIQIAKKTLKMPDAMAGVMGGMTKKEAVQLLIKHNIKY